MQIAQVGNFDVNFFKLLQRHAKKVECKFGEILLYFYFLLLNLTVVRKKTGNTGLFEISVANLGSTPGLSFQVTSRMFFRCITFANFSMSIFSLLLFRQKYE